MTLPETNSEFTPEKCMGIFIPFLSFFGWPYISENESNCCFENINWATKKNPIESWLVNDGILISWLMK